MIDLAAVPLMAWGEAAACRLIPSRFPTVGLYDAIADPADLDVVFALEALTNPRLRQEAGALALVPPAERVWGAGSTPIMAAFTHLNPEGSRFSDGQYGVYYAAESRDTAIAEVAHHRSRFLRHTRQAPIELDFREVHTAVREPLHDLRGLRDAHPALYDPDAYGAAQALGRQLRAAGSWGAAYHSVRRATGLCLGAFRPRALGPAREAGHLTLHWDGQRISHWYEKAPPQAL